MRRLARMMWGARIVAAGGVLSLAAGTLPAQADTSVLHRYLEQYEGEQFRARVRADSLWIAGELVRSTDTSLTLYVRRTSVRQLQFRELTRLQRSRQYQQAGVVVIGSFVGAFVGGIIGARLGASRARQAEEGAPGVAALFFAAGSAIGGISCIVAGDVWLHERPWWAAVPLDSLR